MQDAGIALMEASNANIHDNTIENVKYGIRVSVGGAYNHIHDNTFDGCSKCTFKPLRARRLLAQYVVSLFNVWVEKKR